MGNGWSENQQQAHGNPPSQWHQLHHLKLSLSGLIAKFV
jgi:hypothetical protein